MLASGKHKRDGLFIKFLECSIYCGLILLSYYMAWTINITGAYEVQNLNALNDSLLLIVFGSAAILIGNGLFKTLRKSFVENAVIMSMASFYIAIFSMAMAFYSRSFALPRSMIFVAFLLQILMLSVTKCVFISVLRRAHGERRAMVLAPYEEKEMLLEKLLSDYRFSDHLCYFMSPSDERVKDYIGKVDHILISDSVDPLILDSLIRSVMDRGRKLYLVPRIYEIAVMSAGFTQYSDLPLLKVDNLALSWERAVIKRAMDLVISILALIMLLPLMMCIAGFIRISDGGPALFVQNRMTIHNRVFRLYKFRSMRVDAERESGAVLASEEDPRITPVGRFLRRFWLDELPQLINVICGDMSLVGPRPERPEFAEQFHEDIPHFQYRLSVKAGVTGLAQVMGKYTTSPENKIKFDLIYIRNAGILFDLRILADTVKKVILGTLKRGENKDMSYEEALTGRGLVEFCSNGISEFIPMGSQGRRYEEKTV